MDIVRFHSDEKWEHEFGSCRALRLGNIIHFGSIGAVNRFGEIQAIGPYEQTKYILHLIQSTLEDMVGGRPEIVRTRIYLCDANQLSEISRAHRELFAANSPVCSVVVVKSLLREGVHVEIEAEAVC